MDMARSVPNQTTSRARLPVLRRPPPPKRRDNFSRRILCYCRVLDVVWRGRKALLESNARFRGSGRGA